MYEFSSRVRYSETDANGELSWGGLVNYLQDVVTFQSEDLGIGVEYLAKNHQVWVLNFWQIDVTRFPKLGDEIIIGTIPYEIKGFLGFRNFMIRDAGTNEVLVVANSVWTFLDTDRMRPMKASDIMLEKYSMGNRLDMEYAERKVTLSGSQTQAAPIVVAPYMLDTNHHVNNEQYIEMALSFLPTDKKAKHLRAEYKRSAYLGDLLQPTIYTNDESIGVDLTKDGETYVKCQFLF